MTAREVAETGKPDKWFFRAMAYVRSETPVPWPTGPRQSWWQRRESKIDMATVLQRAATLRAKRIGGAA